MMISLLDRVENTVGEGENAGYQHFRLLPQCFPNPSSLGWLKVGIMWYRGNLLPSNAGFSLHFKKHEGGGGGGALVASSWPSCNCHSIKSHTFMFNGITSAKAKCQCCLLVNNSWWHAQYEVIHCHNGRPAVSVFTNHSFEHSLSYSTDFSIFRSIWM